MFEKTRKYRWKRHKNIWWSVLATIDKSLDWKCITTTQHKIFQIRFNPNNIFAESEQIEVKNVNLRVITIVLPLHQYMTLNTKNKPDEQTGLKISTEDSVISLEDSYFEESLDVTLKTNDPFKNRIDTCLVKVGPVALFFEHKLLTSNGKQFKENEHPQFLCLS